MSTPNNPNQPPFNQVPPSQPGQFPQQGYPQQPPQGYQQFSQGQYPPPQGFPQQPMVPQTPPKKKRRGWLIAGIIVAVLLFGCIGAGVAASRSGATATTSSVVGTTSNKVTPTTQPTQASSYKVGDVVKVGDAWDVTVLSAKADPGSSTFQPKNGMQYFVLNTAMKNLTTKNHTVSSIIQFTLRSDDGTKYNNALYTPDGTTAIDGNVDGGQPAKGIISYEVPTNVKSFHLTFESNPFDANSGRATWNITI